MAKNKPAISIYWAASCGGCEIAFVNLHERILDVAANFDLVFCPCLMDTKKKDVEAMADKSLAITLFNGAIRSEENAEMARLLRKKSQVLIAYGSCSSDGCIPGLANLSQKQDIFRSSYLENPTTQNPGSIVPQAETAMPEGTLHLPALLDRVMTLAETVDVDYFIPGCPPEAARIWEVVDNVIQGKPLPPKGSVVGAGRSAVCDECERTRTDKRIKRIFRTWEIVPDPKACLLDQGIVCMGIATRNGCGALCPKVNMPCTGCYGAPEGVLDQGAKMVAALGSILDVEALRGLPEEDIPGRVNALLAGIPDPAGAFYKYSLPHSLLKGRIS